MSVVAVPASLITPVPIRLRTTFFFCITVLLSYRGGQEQPVSAARSFNVFDKKKRHFRSYRIYCPTYVGLFEAAPSGDGLLFFVVRVRFCGLCSFFFCINVLSLLDYPTYGGFLCRVSMSESS